MIYHGKLGYLETKAADKASDSEEKDIAELIFRRCTAFLSIVSSNKFAMVNVSEREKAANRTRKSFPEPSSRLPALAGSVLADSVTIILWIRNNA